MCPMRTLTENYILPVFTLKRHWTSISPPSPTPTFSKKDMIFIPLEVLTLVMTVCWFLPSSLGDLKRQNARPIFWKARKFKSKSQKNAFSVFTLPVNQEHEKTFAKPELKLPNYTSYFLPFLLVEKWSRCRSLSPVISLFLSRKKYLNQL